MTYKVLKMKGSGANIDVQNIETMASVTIGRPTIEILDILSKDGYTTSADDPDKNIDIITEWNIEVSDDVAKELTRTAMKMKKPIRKAVETKSEQDVKTSTGNKKQPVDVFNLIFGISE